MEYRKPENPGFLGSQWRPKIAALLAFVLINASATEYLAFAFLRLGKQFELTSFHIFGLGLYEPFSWAKWSVQYWRWIVHYTPPYSIHFYIAVGIFFILGFLGPKLISDLILTLSTLRLTKGMEDLYGSSRWAGKRDLKKTGLSEKNHGGVVLGLWREEGSKSKQWKYLRDKSMRHILVAAATETGKTATCVIMTALEWSQSMFVLDVKEEIYKATAGWRQRQGHICLKFSPKEREGCARYNPLGFIRMGTDYEISDTQIISQGIANPGREGEQSEHWNQTSESLIDGVILHELYRVRNEHGRMATMRDISSGLSPYETSFVDYLKAMTKYEHDPEGKMGWRLPNGKKTKVHPVVWEKAQEALNRPDDEAGSVLSTAKKRFALFVDPLVNYATSESDWKIEDLTDADRPVSLYVVIPPSDKERLAPLVRILVLCFINRMSEKQVKGRRKVLALLDEVPMLEYVKPLEKAPSYIRGYGVKFMLIVQDYGQLIKYYGQRNEFFTNCQIRLCFAAADIETAEMLSKVLGTFTIQHASYSFSGLPKLLVNGEGVSASVQNTKRSLLEPEEIMRLELPEKEEDIVKKPGEFIMTVFGCMPIKGKQAFWFFDPKAKARVGLPIKDQSQALSPKAFERELEALTA